MREKTLTRAITAVTIAGALGFGAFAYAHRTSANTTASSSSTSAAKTATSSSSAPGSSAAGSSSPSPSMYSVAPLLKPAKKYLGVAMDGVPDSMVPLTAFAKQIGKQPNMVEYYVPWGSTLNQNYVENVYNAGALPVIQFEPATPSVASIAAGSSDTYTTALAGTIKMLNVPVVVSFGHEMNGDWDAWGTKDTTAADFVAAWKRIHDIFTRVGATNVIWLWNVNVMYPVPNTKLKPLYPGDAYVDWVGITGYYNDNSGGRSTFSTLFLPTIDDVRLFTQKSILIAETGASPSTDKPNEITDLFANVTARADVLGLIWFDYDKTGPNETDWRIDSDPISAATFARQAQQPAYGFTVH